MGRRLKKLGIMALTMTMLLTGCGSNGNDSNNNSNSENVYSDGEILDAASESSIDSEEPQVKKGDIWIEASIDDFSGDWEAEEEYGYSPFWLKYADFSDLERKNLYNVMFYDEIPFGTDLTEIMMYGNYYELMDSDEKNVLFESNEINEFWNYLNEIPMAPGDSAVIYEHMEMEDDPDKKIKITMYNFKDYEMTMEMCTYQEYFYVEFSGGFNANKMLGVDFGESELRTGMTEVMDILGKPAKILCIDSDCAGTDRSGKKESFTDTLETGGGNIAYELIYEQDGWILCLKMTESNSTQGYAGNGSFIYLSPGIYEELNMEDGYRIYEIE